MRGNFFGGRFNLIFLRRSTFFWVGSKISFYLLKKKVLRSRNLVFWMRGGNERPRKNASDGKHKRTNRQTWRIYDWISPVGPIQWKYTVITLTKLSNNFCPWFPGTFTQKRRQRWDKTDNLRQSTACSELKFTLVLKMLYHHWRGCRWHFEGLVMGGEGSVH